MRSFRVVCWLVASLTLISLAPSAIAQVNQVYETGLNPYATYQSGNIDSINLFNRGLNVDIPLISYPQRGGKLTLDFDLHYLNQGNWYNCTPGTNCSGFYGTTLTNGFGVILKNWPSIWGTTCQSTGDQWGDWTCQGSATMSDGSSHSMLPITVSNWESDDTSGLQLGGFDLQASNNPPLLIDANGTRYSQTYTPSLFPGPVGQVNTLNYVPTLVEDSNGNEISYSQTAGWTDTMGRSIPLPVSVSTGICPQTPLVPVSAYTWNLPGVSAGTYSLTFCYVNVAATEDWDNQILNVSLLELQTVLLPNRTSWTFQYTTDGNGDLSQITFPTGGTLSYTWRTGYPVCGPHYYDNSREVVSRTLNPKDGVSPAATWNYNSISNLIPVVTDPASNDTVHTFSSLTANTCPYYEMETQYYQGSHTSGTLLKTVNTKYQALSSSPYLAGIGQPSQTTSSWANGQENETAYTYDNALTFHAPDYGSPTEFSTHTGGVQPPASYGLVETKKEYDYGSSAPGTLLRTTTTAYQALSNSNYLTNNLLSLPASVAVTGSGPGSTTTYAYDQTTPVASGITTQHTTTPPGGTYRGNPTTVSRYLNTTGTYLSTTSTNWDTGMVDVVTDPKTHQTKYGYSSTYAGAYVTSVTNALNQTSTFAYDFNSGLLTSTTDPNSQTTIATYDDMFRPASLTYTDGESESITRQETSFPFSATLTKKITSSLNEVTETLFDGLGRGYQTEINSDLPSATYSVTQYDALGRQSTVYNPTRCSPPTTNCNESSWGFTTYVYDALSRPTKVTEADGSILQNSYTGSSATSTDEAGKKRTIVTDGLGRMTEVFEDPSGFNYETIYAYDALNDLTSVSQNSSRPRSFVYDSLARLTSANNPETGTIAYTYDSDGNVLTRLDARSTKTTYTYDQLNRVLSKAYTDTTPPITYAYDGNAPTCTTGVSSYGLAKGQRTAMCDGPGFEAWTYNDVTNTGWQVIDKRNTNGVTESTTAQNNLAGGLATQTYPSGRTITYTYNGAGRPTEAQDIANGISYVENGAYVPNGAGLNTLSFGTHVNVDNIFNSRFQPCWIYATVGGGLPFNSVCTSSGTTGSILDLKFNFAAASSDNGNVISITNDRFPNRSQAFTYDNLNRILTATTTATHTSDPTDCWGEAYVYDNVPAGGGAWGNLTNINVASTSYNGCTQESLSLTASTKNQFTGDGYDSAGNVTSNGSATFTYNAENELTTAAGVTYKYDGDNKRISKSSGKTYWYAGGSTPIAETDASGNTTDEYIFLGGIRVARRDSAGNVVYYMADHLGTSRIVTDSLGNVLDQSDFYPFGGERVISASSGNTYKFTGKERDAESNLDNFEARYMASTQGRFMSPDPSGLVYADQTNPQSFNLYSYVRNNPLNFTDPNGLDCVYLADDGSISKKGNENFGPNGVPLGPASIDHNSTQGMCNGTGGYWANGYIGSLTSVQTFSNTDTALIASNVGGITDFTLASQGESQGGFGFNHPSSFNSGQFWDPSQGDTNDYINAIHDQLSLLPEVCSVTISLRVGAGPASYGGAWNSASGFSTSSSLTLAYGGPVTISTSTNGSRRSFSASAAIPETPFYVGASTRDGRRVSSVNVGAGGGPVPVLTAQASANLGQRYGCK